LPWENKLIKDLNEFYNVLNLTEIFIEFHIHRTSTPLPSDSDTHVTHVNIVKYIKYLFQIAFEYISKFTYALIIAFLTIYKKFKFLTKF